MVATQDEVEALMRVTAEIGQGIVHVAPGENYAWVYDFQPTLGRTDQLVVDPHLPAGVDVATRPYREKLADHAARRVAGCRRVGAGDVPADPAGAA